jgi:hypothetical protein
MLPWAVLAVVVTLGASILWARREEVGQALTAIGLGGVLLSVLPTTVAVIATSMCWRVWLGTFGVRPPTVVSAKLFFVTQAGKYLPGSVWPFLAQAALSRTVGLGRAAVFTATGLFLMTHIATGVAAGALTVGPAALDRAWLVAAALACAFALTPPVQRAVLRLARRVRPSFQVPPGLTWRRTGVATLAMAVAWAGYGTATYALAAPLGASPADLWLITGAYGLAWVVGFLVVAAPAGAGAREVVLIALLTPVVGGAGAIAVAVLSRVVVTAVDLALGAASVEVLSRRDDRAASPAPSGH